MTYDLTRTFPGPDSIYRKQFSNGFTLLVRENPLSRAAAFRVCMPCGNFLDPVGKNGLAGYVTGALTSGTQLHDFREIHEMLENCGASLNFSANTSYISAGGGCLSEDLPAVLGLMKEVMDVPVFPEEYFQILRNKILTSYELALQDPEARADERFDAILYGDTPYGRPLYGSTEIIRAMTRKDLVDYHRKYFGPRGLILSIAGGVRAEEAADVCEKLFGSWDKPQETVDRDSYFPDVPAPEHSVSEHIEIPEKSEMMLVIGTMGPKRKAPEYTAAVLGNCILGEFGMMGRIGQIVREDNGLAYSVSASFDSALYGGSWSVDAGVNPANVERTAELLMGELRRFASEKVTEEELDDVKSYAIGSLPFGLESNSGVAGSILRMEVNQLGLDHLMKAPDRIRSVTAEEILETARKWLDPERMIRVTAGTAAL